MKDKFKNIVASSLIVVLCLVLGFAFVVRADNDNIENNDGGTINIYNNGEAVGEGMVGGSTSDDWNVGGNLSVTGETVFAGNVVIGGATTTITATTSAGNLLLTAAQICDSGSDIDLASGIDAGAFTVTLPTAALLAADCLGTNGSKTIWINNNSGDNATITAGTGGDLLEGDGLNVVIATTHQASIEIQMLGGGTTYRAAVVEWQDAD